MAARDGRATGLVGGNGKKRMRWDQLSVMNDVKRVCAGSPEEGEGCEDNSGRGSSEDTEADCAVYNVEDFVWENTERERWFLKACDVGDVETARLLLANGEVNVDARYEEGPKKGRTALLKTLGPTEVVEMLIAHNVDVNAKDPESGETPLYSAYDDDIVETLLKASADPNVFNRMGETPLHKAVEDQCCRKVELLLSYGAAVDAVSKGGLRPIHIFLLMIAGVFDFVEGIDACHGMAQALVSYGAKWDDTCDEIIDEKGKELQLSFRVALQWWIGEHTRGVEKLTSIPEEVFLRGPNDVERYLAMLHASNKIILRRKVCVVGPSFWGKTSLVKSVSEGKPVLEHPDDRTIGIDQFGLSFSEKVFSDEDIWEEACRDVSSAAVWRLIDNTRDLRSLPTAARVGDMVRMGWWGLLPGHSLVGSDGHLCIPTKRKELKRMTPLIGAVKRKHHEIVQLLLDNGADPNAQSEYGDTPLTIATHHGNPGMVAWLLSAGADPNLADSDGDTPLHYASRTRFLSAARLLLQCGARVNAVGKFGRTPLHCCIISCPEMTSTLLEAGADATANDEYGETPFHYIVRSVVRVVLSGIESDELSSLLEAARSMLLYQVGWDEQCEEIVRDEIERAQPPGRLIGGEQDTTLASFPTGMFAFGPIGAIQFVTECERRRAQTHQITVDRPSSSMRELATHDDDSPADVSSNGIGEASSESKPSTVSPVEVATTAKPPKSLEEPDVVRHHEVTFWDFAGQEAYQVAHSVFFSKRTLYIVCVDLHAYAVALEQAELRADKESDIDRLMDEFVDCKILRWIRLILANQPDAEFVFVGTKADVLVRTSHRIINAHKDVEERMAKYAESIENNSCDIAERPRQLLLRGSSLSSRRTSAKLASRVLAASAKRLRQLKWLVVNCKDEESIQTARKAIEQIIIDSKRSFQMPDLYSAVLDIITMRRREIVLKGPSSQVTATFLKTADVNVLLRTEAPEQAHHLSDGACAAIMRTLHDIGDVLWFEDLGIDYLKDVIILHPLVLIDFVRQIVHHNHNTEVMTHALLKEQPFWDDLSPQRMLVMKQLLQQFHLVLPTGSEMKYNSDLIVPAFWRSRESALWLFLGDLLVNDPSLEKIPKDYFVQWEYHFTTSLPDVMFDELIIESYLRQYKRQAGPDWIFYRVEDEFACRVVLTRASRTLERVLRVEAIASKSATTFMWGRFEHLCECLERVVSQYKGLVVTRFVVDDEGTSVGLEDFVEEWIETPERRREPKRWLPPCLKWYYDNVMRNERVDDGK